MSDVITLGTILVVVAFVAYQWLKKTNKTPTGEVNKSSEDLLNGGSGGDDGRVDGKPDDIRNQLN